MRKRSWNTKSGTKYCFYYEGPRVGGKKPKPIALGSNYKEALKQWAQIEGEKIEDPENGTLGAVYLEYMKWANSYKLSGLEPRTLKNYVNNWKQLEKPFAHINIDNFRSEWFLEYFEARSSQSSAKKELKFLSTVFNWARSRSKMHSQNPLSNMFRFMKVDERRDIYVPDESYQLVYNCGDQLVKDAMEFCYLCANRPAESSNAKFTDIKDDILTIHLSKTRKSGIAKKLIPLRGDLKKFIDLQKKKSPRSMYLVSDEKGQQFKPAGQFRKRFDKARQLAKKKADESGVEFVWFQLRDLRAKAATDIDDKFGIEEARKLLGHTTQKQTADYIRPLKGQKAQALDNKKPSLGESKILTGESSKH